MIPLDDAFDAVPDEEIAEHEESRCGNVEERYHNPLYDRTIRFEPEQEIMLLRLAKDGDPDALESIVVNFMPFVISIARRWTRGRGDVDEDLVSEGVIGLMSAIPLYDDTMGTRFSTYAKTRIMGMVRLGHMRSRSLVMIRPNQSTVGLFDNLNKAKEKLGVLSSGDMSWTDAIRLAEALRSTPGKVQDMDARMMRAGIAIENLELQEVRMLNPLLEDEDIEGALADETLQRRMEETLDTILRSLDPREQQIMRDRILADEPMTLEECGGIYGVTRERIRQVEARMMSRIRRGVEVIDPMLAREMGSDVQEPEVRTDEPHRRVLTARTRPWGHGAKARLIGNVLDDKGRIMARFPVEPGEDNPAEAYIRGHDVGSTRDAVDEHGMSVRDTDEGCEIVELGSVVAVEKDQKSARAWIDGFRAGHEWASENRTQARSARSWGTVRATRTSPEGDATRHATSPEATDAVESAGTIGTPETDVTDEDREIEPAVAGEDVVDQGIASDDHVEAVITEEDDEADTPSDADVIGSTAPPVPMHSNTANPPAMRHRSARAVAGFMKWNAIKAPKKGVAGRRPRNEP